MEMILEPKGSRPFVILSAVEGSDIDRKGEVCSKNGRTMVTLSDPSISVGMTQRRKSRADKTLHVIGTAVEESDIDI